MVLVVVIAVADSVKVRFNRSINQSERDHVIGGWNAEEQVDVVILTYSPPFPLKSWSPLDRLLSQV